MLCTRETLRLTWFDCGKAHFRRELSLPSIDGNIQEMVPKDSP